MELLEMARGNAALVPGVERTAGEIQKEMLALPPATGSAEEELAHTGHFKPLTIKELENRCGQAHETARETLASAALLTEAYFLFTPAQIWLAALMLADEPLTRFYVSTKFGPAELHQAHLGRIMATLRGCADELAKPVASSREELVRVDKKLYQCQNPEKRDLVGLNAAMKRNGVDATVMDASEKAAKKRRMEREQLERNGDVFGPPLPTR